MEPIRVIIAASNPNIRKEVRKSIEKNGRFQIIDEVENGIDTLLSVGQLNPNLLLIELDLPILSGQQVIQKLREVRSSVWVLPISSQQEDPNGHGPIDDLILNVISTLIPFLMS